MERDCQQKAHEMSTFFEKRGYFRTPLEDDLQQASRVCMRDAIQDANVVTNGTEDSLDVYVPSFQQSHQRFLSELRNHQGDSPSASFNILSTRPEYITYSIFAIFLCTFSCKVSFGLRLAHNLVAPPQRMPYVLSRISHNHHRRTATHHRKGAFRM